MLLKKNIMKNYASLYITTLSFFLYSVYAQNTTVSNANNKVQETQTVPKTESKTNSTDVKTYHVEENINNKFGGHTTTYDVLDPNHINKTDLGPNNTRVVTPRLAKEEKIIPENKPEKAIVTAPIPKEEHNDYAFVFMIKTYERIAEKGYKSVEMFQKLGNSYFFNSEMEKAARWYCELFEMSNDLDSEYYYRYAKSLKAIGENDKANEILAKFNQKNSKQ